MHQVIRGQHTEPTRYSGDLEFRRLLEKLPAAAYTCDAEGLITYYNRRALELWGRAPKLNDAVDRYCGSFRLFAPDGSPITHECCWMAVALREDEEYNGHEIVVERADGSRRTVLAHANPFHDEQGTLLGAVNVLVDITDRKCVEDALRQSEERVRAIVETTPECVALVAADGTLLSMNMAGLAMVEAEAPEAVVGQSVYRLIAPEYRQPFREFNERVCRGQGSRLEFEIVGLRGKRRHMETHAVPLPGSGGRYVQLAVTRDVTQQKQLERDLLQRNADLEEADRRTSEFLAMLSHELRSPLGPLRDGLQIIRLANHDGAAVEQARAMMERQLRHMVRLIDDLLDLSRIRTGHVELRRERIDLAAPVQDALEASRPIIEASAHELTVTLPPYPLWVDADRTRLAQVFSNLLNNSAKYTDRGGRIWLIVEQQGSDAVVKVKDNGAGISDDLLPQVFDMFIQADRSLERTQGGLGIGLSLVRGLVEMHGGKVAAHSDGPGKGSEFVVRLPVMLSPLRGLQEADAGGDSHDPCRYRILVVDDNEDSAISLAMMLRLMGHDTRTADDGLAALEAASTFRPDVVILDIGLPKLNGYDACRRLREQPWGRGMVIIALTGWGQDEDKRRSKDAGFNFHMVKPADPAALEKLLNGLPLTPA